MLIRARTVLAEHNGERVDIEVDVTAEYIEKLISWNGADVDTVGAIR